MCVVKLISPIYILLLLTESCQFAFRVYGWLFGLMFGAFFLRLLAHTYNISLALSVFLTPTLLIALQPKLAARFSKKHKTVRVSSMDARTTTSTYFDELNKMWL
ncbi:unnamed protein product [Cylicostephanus goldi]|uniref:Uncharacterized protein n=1 Tax=Cylicostephanus goldi TaxID=71465 RepID=A0A3P7NR67_CYLGO|nr:unnamed protein product [Cylicostephanus goldi]